MHYTLLMISRAVEEYYNKYKIKKPSKHPNDYQRGFEDGFNKGRLAAAKDIEDIIAEKGVMY